MIQRIQSIFIFFAFVSTISLLGIWGDEWISNHDYIFFGFLSFSALLSILSLFSYKKRALQMKMNNLNIFINLSFIGLSIYFLLMVSGGILFSEKGIEFVALIAIVVLVMILLAIANHFIKKDDKLVKSVNRIR